MTYRALVVDHYSREKPWRLWTQRFLSPLYPLNIAVSIDSIFSCFCLASVYNFSNISNNPIQTLVVSMVASTLLFYQSARCPMRSLYEKDIQPEASIIQEVPLPRIVLPKRFGARTLGRVIMRCCDLYHCCMLQGLRMRVA